MMYKMPWTQQFVSFHLDPFLLNLTLGSSGVPIWIGRALAGRFEILPFFFSDFSFRIPFFRLPVRRSRSMRTTKPFSDGWFSL